MTKLYLCQYLSNNFIASFMKKDISLNSYFLIILLFICYSCAERSPISENKEGNYHIQENSDLNITINKVDTVCVSNTNNEFIFTAKYNKNFVFGNQYIFDISFPGDTKSYHESKSYVLVENSLKSNSFMAFIVDKQYGIEDYVFIDYITKGGIITVFVNNLFYNKLCDIEINTSKRTFMVSKIQNNATRSINICDVLITYCGLVWTVGFSAVSMGGAAFVAASIYAFLDQIACHPTPNTIVCPSCGANSTHLIAYKDEGYVECDQCGLNMTIELH